MNDYQMYEEGRKEEEIKQCNIDLVSEPLLVDTMTISLMDIDGDIEFEIADNVSCVNEDEAKQIIDYLTKILNAR